MLLWFVTLVLVLFGSQVENSDAIDWIVDYYCYQLTFVLGRLPHMNKYHFEQLRLLGRNYNESDDEIKSDDGALVIDELKCE